MKWNHRRILASNNKYANRHSRFVLRFKFCLYILISCIDYNVSVLIFRLNRSAG